MLSLQPTIFNQTDDHIIDSNIELSPSQLYEKQFRGVKENAETKENIDRRIKEIEETSIERIKRKYLKMSPQVSPVGNISEDRKERMIQKCPPKSNKSLQQNKVLASSKKPAVCKMMHSAKRAPMQSRRKLNIPLQVKAKRPSNISHSKTPSTAPARKKEKEKEKGLKALFEILYSHASHCQVLKQLLEDAGFQI